MPEKNLQALQNSLEGIAPDNGIAYLLNRVVQNYWIPVATSNQTLEKIDYYSLVYAFDLMDHDGKEPRYIEDDISELVSRGKIEAFTFNAPFYQEVIQVSESLVIIRSSMNGFTCISNEARRGIPSLISLVHNEWGEQSFRDIENITISSSGDSPIKIATAAAQKAADIISDIHRFPPYFLLTDYVLSVYLNETQIPPQICSNPLGYTHWILKNLASNCPPWIAEMGKKTSNYSEDLRDPTDHSLKNIYNKALLDRDILALRLTEKLRDDVILVAYVPNSSLKDAKVKLWARHNRLKDSLLTINNYSPIGCSSVAEALGVLLLHMSTAAKQNSDDFLIVSWATFISDYSDANAIHVSCDTSHRLIGSETVDEKWKTVCRPDNVANAATRIEIKYRPLDTDHNNIEYNIGRVLDHSYKLFGNLDVKATIDCFCSTVIRKKHKYCDLFRLGDDYHDPDKWINAPAPLVAKLKEVIEPDLNIIGHLTLTKWSGLSTFDDNFRMSYVNIATLIKEPRLAAELIEVVFGKDPTKKEKPEYIDLSKSGTMLNDLLYAFYILSNDGWDLKFAEIRKNILSQKRDIFALCLQKKAATDDNSKLLYNILYDTTDLNYGEMRTGCKMLRGYANKFGVFEESENKSIVSVYIEFDGGIKHESVCCR